MREIFRSGALLAAVVAYIAAVVPVNIVPHQVTAFTEIQQLTPGPAGVVIMFETAALALAMMLSSRIPSRIMRDTAIVAALAAAVGQLGCIFAPGVVWLCLFQILAGAGCGIAAGIVIRVISESSAAGTGFGLANALTALLSGILVLGVPWYPSENAAVRIFIPLSALAIVLAYACYVATRGFISRMPNPLKPDLLKPSAADIELSALSMDRQAAAALILGTFLIYLPLGGIWTFSVYQGIGLGFSEREIGGMLTWMMLGGTSGGALATFMYQRFKPVVLMLLACALGVGTCVAVSAAQGGLGFTLAFVIYAVAYMFALSTLQSTATLVDSQGKLPAIVLGFSIIGNAVGSLLIGYLLEFGRPEMVASAGAWTCAAATVPLVWSMLRVAGGQPKLALR